MEKFFACVQTELESAPEQGRDKKRPVIADDRFGQIHDWARKKGDLSTKKTVKQSLHKF